MVFEFGNCSHWIWASADARVSQGHYHGVLFFFVCARAYLQGGYRRWFLLPVVVKTRGEHTMLHIQNSLIVFPFFGRFVLLAGSSYVFGAIARSIGVEHPHVKVGVLCLVPKTTSLDVEACLCTKNCRSVGEGFTSQGLEVRHCDRLRRVVWQS